MSQCPQCYTEVLPVLVDEDLAATLNWNEWRALVNWADGYLKTITPTSSTRKVFERIVEHLSGLRPRGAEPLTITQQIGEFHRDFPETDFTRVNDVVVAKPTLKKVTAH